ncbi:MAG: 4Fe-4S binding protein [Synergistaceae bacterium]|nr:4Fe-4S binding protein [Synergistaceae bacterium]
MAGGVKVNESRCRGCANCIKSCPTEAIRVIDGLMRIIPDLCIDCGECIRSCESKAISVNEDEWDLIKSREETILMADPTFYVQAAPYSRPRLMKEALESLELTDIAEYAAIAFDLAAYAAANLIREGGDHRPFISTYCPAVIRLIQINFPELVERILPVESPLETAVTLWRSATGSKKNVTLVSPCPAKATLARNPVGRTKSSLSYVVSVSKVIRDLLAHNVKVTGEGMKTIARRWLLWSISGGESRHISAFLDKGMTSISVSGLRNTMDLLKELELGRLDGIDFIECRACDLGCIGGTGTYESRFLSHLRLENLETEWLPAQEEMEVIREWYEKGIWRLDTPIPVKERLPLSQNLEEAMAKLREMDAIYAGLPHIDCGACGRPSCRALAEDIVRGQGDETDCIFKLRERISLLSGEIHDLSSRLPHTIHPTKKRRSVS